MIERSLDFQLLYVASITPNTSSTGTMNVSVINLLNVPINATLQLNNSVPVNFSEIVDYGRWDTNYSISQGSNYFLTIAYNGTNEENITIDTRANEGVYAGFFNITLVGSETIYKDKFQKSYNLP